jgi:hypothetical protein
MKKLYKVVTVTFKLLVLADTDKSILTLAIDSADEELAGFSTQEHYVMSDQETEPFEFEEPPYDSKEEGAFDKWESALWQEAAKHKVKPL